MTQDLKAWYRARIPTRIYALETARVGLAGRDEEAVDAVRRLAHTLRGSGATYGYPEITDSAKAVEDAPEVDLLPRVDALVATLRAVRAREDEATQGLLIVEDDPDLGAYLETLLRKPGRVLYRAATAAQALVILEEREVSLILLDLILPDTDGRNLLVKLRERLSSASIPVIVTTAKGAEQTRAECLALGADDFLEKPVPPEILEAAVAARLRRGEGARQLRRDPLTGLPNRAALHEAFQRGTYVAGLAGEELTLAVLNLEGIRALKGDQLLRRVAGTLGRSLRATDVLARWGGEEFVAIFPRTGVEGAVHALENAQAALRKEAIILPEGRTVSLTFSAGVARVKEGMTVEDAVAAADRLLSAAKAEGTGQLLSDADRRSPPKRRILVAEDDELIRLVVRRLLEKEGFEVEACPDGQAALEAATRGGHALILTDVRMPVLDGFGLLRRLRALPELARTPVVILSSMGDEEDVVKGFELGADDYILKPFASAELAARVRRLIR
jgi:two-component system, cell cycle response regulator